jgi:aminopeptidase N
MNNQQLSGLNKASIKKRQEALIRTEEAIAKLANNKQKITIRSVAREAKVSVSYIYKYPELAYKIQCLREQQKYDLVFKNKTGEKVDQKAELWRIEKAKLIQEIAELKAITERGRIGKNDLETLKIENLHLATENVRLKKELKYTQQSLQDARSFILEQRQLNQVVQEY